MDGPRGVTLHKFIVGHLQLSGVLSVSKRPPNYSASSKHFVLLCMDRALDYFPGFILLLDKQVGGGFG